MYRLKIISALILTMINYHGINAEITTKKSTIRVIKKSLLTYNYSSPREYIETGRLYPYHRFDGYNRVGEMETWDMIEMENDYIKLWIVPAIGGKIWGAVEKKTGKEFLYYNHVVKFRDVSSRGPWTSGGLEMNFGVIGHSPWCSSQVDYIIKEHPNGNVSCTVGGLDISLGTDWRVEIILPSEKAYIETKILWHNGTLEERPLYQWMNAGIKTKGDLQYYYPGTNYLTHDGKVNSWPNEKGYNINRYEENNFGHYKSYHVSGKYNNFWGAYWHNDNFGMAHVSSYDDKLGKKIWIWGLSRYGMVWEDLLTDTDGQYTEVQSGKLFNQSIGTSFTTPFKHCSMQPGHTYTWSEYWMPIGNIKGIDFCNEEIAYAFDKSNKGLFLNLYAVAVLDTDLIIHSNDNEILRKKLSLKPTDIDFIKIPENSFSTSDYKIYLGDELLYSSKLNDVALQRPNELPSDFNHQSAYGLYLQGKEFLNQNFPDKAIEYYKKCLEKEPYFSPSLIDLASIYYQRNQFKESRNLIDKALQVNTYDPRANLIYAKIASINDNKADAIDGYSVAMQDPSYASIAAREAAIIHFKEHNYKKSKQLLEKSLSYNPMNIEAAQLLIVHHRLLGNLDKAMDLIQSLLDIDPLNYIAYYENFLISKKEIDKKKITELIVNEYWYRSYLSIFSFYERINHHEEAINILADLPKHPYILYRKAYLLYSIGEKKMSQEILKQANDCSASLVYPNLSIDEKVYKWAHSSDPTSWKPSYYLALLYLSFNRIEEAGLLLRECKNEPDFYAFYLTRAKYITQNEDDYKTALNLNRTNYLCYTELANFYMRNNQFDKAIRYLSLYQKNDNQNSYINLLLAKALALSKKYNKAINLLKNTDVLPNEGSLEGRNIWRECNISYAISLIEEGKYEKAASYINAAREWPENLGVGRPYDDSVDERLEDLLSWYINHKLNIHNHLYEDRINSFSIHRLPDSSMNLFTLLFKRKNGNLKNTDLQTCFNDAILNNKIASKWSYHIFNGKFDKAKEEKDQVATEITPLPFEIIFDDRDFNIIKSNYGLFEDIIRLIMKQQSNLI